MRLSVLLVCLPGLCWAGGHDALFGSWGSPAECRGELLLPGGSVAAAPRVIGPDWLRHGNVWCRLRWFAPQPRAQGLFTTAQALCGEDSVQSYRIDFDLENLELHLIWNETRLDGPLRRCAGSE